MKGLMFLLCLLILCILSKGKKVHRKLKSEEQEEEEVNRDGRYKIHSQHAKKGNIIEKEDPFEETLSNEESIKLQQEERKLRRDLQTVREEEGRLSMKYVTGLHQLGRVIYQQHRFGEVFSIAEEIVKIHETLDGPEHINTAKALTNVGSTANRLGRLKECEIAMNRALYIFLKLYGPESKEVLLHRGQMLTFKIPFAKTSMGLSYDDYLFEL